MRTTALAVLFALFLAGCNSATAQTSPSPAPRSSVAGTWTLTLSNGRVYNVHLAGPDVALTGVWLGANVTDTNGGTLAGDFAAGVLRLSAFSNSSAYPYSGSTHVEQLVDCAVALDGNSASGTAYGYEGQTSPATMARVAPPSPP